MPKQVYEVSWTITFGRYVGTGKVSKDHLAVKVRDIDDKFAVFKTFCGKEVTIKTKHDVFSNTWSHEATDRYIDMFGNNEDLECGLCARAKRKFTNQK
jgi:hypothetical protein